MADSPPTGNASARGGFSMLATAPARWVSRYRPDLAASLRADAAAFAGSRARLFTAVALFAVAYPIIASLLHALVGPQPPGEDFLAYAIAPYVTFVYLDSLPFMIAVAGVGVFSPALGVLLLAVFVPADLSAVFVASWDYPLVGAPNQIHPVQGGVPARLISYAILWILAVEIPLRARRWAAGWRSSRGSPPSRLVGSVVLALGFAVLVAFWTYSALWLVQPVALWIYNGSVNLTLRVSAATWMFGWVVVAGAALIAFAAGMTRPADGDVAETEGTAVERPRRGLVRQLVTVAVAAALLSGLMQGWLEGILIVVGLLVAGPVLTMILPRMRIPRWISGLRPPVRWSVAMAATLGVTWLAVSAAAYQTSTGAISDYLLLTILLAVLLPAFRVVVEAGASQEPPTDATARIPPVITAILQLLVVSALWLAFPVVALAHDPPEAGVTSQYPISAAALTAAAAAAAAAVAGSRRSEKDPPDKYPPTSGTTDASGISKHPPPKDSPTSGTTDSKEEHPIDSAAPEAEPEPAPEAEPSSGYGAPRDYEAPPAQEPEPEDP